jgi:hypothetical protein
MLESRDLGRGGLRGCEGGMEGVGNRARE